MNINLPVYLGNWKLIKRHVYFSKAKLISCLLDLRGDLPIEECSWFKITFNLVQDTFQN